MGRGRRGAKQPLGLPIPPDVESAEEEIEDWLLERAKEEEEQGQIEQEREEAEEDEEVTAF